MMSSDKSESGQCSAFCRKLKSWFCCERPYDTSDIADIPRNIEQSAVEYGLKYGHHLDEPLTTGSLVIVTATPSEDISRFAINVGSGDSWSDRCDIALHFNPRMPQRYVVRNSRSKTSWGTEETTSFRSFPFKAGREFTLQLLVTDSEWLIAVDGQHYCSYGHRQPAAAAAWVQVTDISEPSVKVIQTDSYPLFGPEPAEVPHRRRADLSGPEPSWTCHTSALLPRGVADGEQLVIVGRVRALPHSFQVELADGVAVWPHAVVHLHVNPRLCAAPTRARQLVVLNSWRGGWGAEVRQATGKIIGGSVIRLRIVRGSSEWVIWCDDIELGEFPFRTDPDTVRALRIRGDLAPRHIYTCPSH